MKKWTSWSKRLLPGGTDYVGIYVERTAKVWILYRKYKDAQLEPLIFRTRKEADLEGIHWLDTVCPIM
jgi:hypothetical protein